MPLSAKNSAIRTFLSIIFWNFYNVLVQVRFAASNAKLDFLYNKLGIPVPSQVAKQLKN